MNPKPPYSDHPDPTGLQTLEVISRAGHFNRWMYQTIRPYLTGSILEIGSGIGNISALLIQERLTITLSDYDPAYCNLLTRKFGGCGNVQNILSINLQHNAFTAAYAPLKERFDTILLLNVIEHLEDDVAAVNNCRYLLKKGGSLIVLAPAYQQLYSRFDQELGHYRRYTTKTLQQLFLKQYFGVVHKQYFNFAGLAGWLFFGKLLGRKMIGAGEMWLYNRVIPVLKFADNLVLKKAGLSAIVAARKN